MIEADVLREMGLKLVGRARDVRERFYAITLEQPIGELLLTKFLVPFEAASFRRQPLTGLELAAVAALGVEQRPGGDRPLGAEVVGQRLDDLLR